MNFTPDEVRQGLRATVTALVAQVDASFAGEFPAEIEIMRDAIADRFFPRGSMPDEAREILVSELTFVLCAREIKKGPE